VIIMIKPKKLFGLLLLVSLIASVYLVDSAQGGSTPSWLQRIWKRIGQIRMNMGILQNQNEVLEERITELELVDDQNQALEQRITDLEAAGSSGDFDQRVSDLEWRADNIEDDVLDLVYQISSGPDYDSGWMSGYTGEGSWSLSFYHDLYTTNVYFILLGWDSSGSIHQINYPGEDGGPWSAVGAYIHSVESTQGQIKIYNYEEGTNSPYVNVRVLMWSLDE